jgi:phosphatidylglycerophosphate synthase
MKYVPNALSLSRVVLLPLLYWLLFTAPPLVFLAAWIALCSTDYLDGKIARKFNVVSSMGKALDSISDLVFYLSTVYFLSYLYPEVVRANQGYLNFLYLLMGFSFLVSGYLFRKPVMMHTSILRLNALIVYFVFIASFWIDSTYLVRFAILAYIVGFTEEILIFIFYGHVDPDTKSILHLMQEKRAKNAVS